jgi:putative ABC transport system permease protein
MDVLFRNIRISVRQLWRQPTFTLAVVLTLSVAIAANTTVFSFVSALLIRPFPFRDPEQLVQIRSVRGGQLGLMSMREVLDIRERVSVLEGVAAHTTGFGGYNYSGEGRPQEWKTILTTGNLFDVLGAPLASGSSWPARADRERDNSVILNHSVWKDTFAGRQDVLGRKITLDHAAGYQIYGVAAESFDYPQGIQVYRSLGGFAMFDQRSYRNVVAVARIRHPYSLARLQSELDNLSRQLAAEYPATNAGLSFRAMSFRELYSGEVRPYLLVLLGAVSFVLLIACANAVSLQLSRALDRAREIGVRVALGASEATLIGQLLTESAVLAMVAALLGIAMAWWWIKVLRDLIGVGLPQWMHIGIDTRVLIFTGAISALAALIAGLAPGLQISRRSIAEILMGSGRGSSGGRNTIRLRDLIVGTEIAVTVVLLAGAGLLIRGFVRLQSRDKGFQSDSISTFRVALGWKRYTDQPSISRYYNQAQQSLSRIAGFEAVAFGSAPPLTRQEESAPNTVQTEEQSYDEALRNPYVRRESVSENYFQVLRIPLRSGRLFTDFDNNDSEPVAIVSANLAKLLWGDKDAIGRRLRYSPSAKAPATFSRDATGAEVLRKIVGVVGDIQDHELGGEPAFHYYVPYRQNAEPNQYMLIKTGLGLLEFRAQTERAFWAIDSEQSLFDFSTYDHRILNTVWQLRMSQTLLILFSGVALVLAAIGVYGVTAYVVGQRQREIGIRMALGSSPGMVRVLIVRHAALVSLGGLGVGLVLAAILGRALAHLLRGVSGSDPFILGGAFTALFAISLGASALPAWRASRIDPVASLRAE